MACSNILFFCFLGHRTWFRVELPLRQLARSIISLIHLGNTSPPPTRIVYTSPIEYVPRITAIFYPCYVHPNIPVEQLTVAWHRPPNLGNLLSYRKLHNRTGLKVSSFIRTWFEYAPYFLSSGRPPPAALPPAQKIPLLMLFVTSPKCGGKSDSYLAIFQRGLSMCPPVFEPTLSSKITYFPLRQVAEPFY